MHRRSSGITGQVHVHYVVPVIAVVDLDTRRVERVVVDDEAIRLDPAADDPASAVDVAEAVTWPRWEHGW